MKFIFIKFYLIFFVTLLGCSNVSKRDVASSRKDFSNETSLLQTTKNSNASEEIAGQMNVAKTIVEFHEGIQTAQDIEEVASENHMCRVLKYSLLTNSKDTIESAIVLFNEGQKFYPNKEVMVSVPLATVAVLVINRIINEDTLPLNAWETIEVENGEFIETKRNFFKKATQSAAKFGLPSAELTATEVSLNELSLRYIPMRRKNAEELLRILQKKTKREQKELVKIYVMPY